MAKIVNDWSQDLREFKDKLKTLSKDGGFIRKETKKSGVYASYYGKMELIDGKYKRTQVHLGKVVDDDDEEEEEIFFNKKYGGFFQFSIKDGYSYRHDYIIEDSISSEHAILNYGTAWLFEDICQQTQFITVLKNLFPNSNKRDTLIALLAYQLSTPHAISSNASNWYEKSFIKILYPSANLSSESISRFLEELGQDYIQDLFFKFYHDFTNRDVINNKLKCKTILIDGTGAPNAIDASRTALSNHMENVKNEIRIINVVDKERGLPIFFKIIPGNILDKTTLEYTITILQSRNID